MFGLLYCRWYTENGNPYADAFNPCINVLCPCCTYPMLLIRCIPPTMVVSSVGGCLMGACVLVRRICCDMVRVGPGTSEISCVKTAASFPCAVSEMSKTNDNGRLALKNVAAVGNHSRLLVSYPPATCCTSKYNSRKSQQQYCFPSVHGDWVGGVRAYYSSNTALPLSLIHI